ncbi:MAG: T9SS type A sorting domain-containing protein [Ignavibacteriales bacterium]|nr:T9SS type A sorting domain-containing protein [Ignavibacteriales bacterium]
MKGPFRWDERKKELYAFGTAKGYLAYNKISRQWESRNFDYDSASTLNIAWVDNYTALMATTQGLYIKSGPYAEWQRIYYSPYSGGLTEIVVKGNDTVLAAGRNGLVIVSTNGGWTYERKYLPADQNFISSGLAKDGRIFLWSSYGTKFTSSDLFNTWEEEFHQFPGEFSNARHANGYELVLTRSGNMTTKFDGTGYYFYDAGQGEIQSQATFGVNSDGRVVIPSSGKYILLGQLPVTPTGITEEVLETPSFRLAGNFPNPFNSATVVPCSIDEEGNYTLEVFDVLGSKVATIFDGFLGLGSHQFKLQSDRIPSGVYLICLSNSKGKRMTTKAILLK